MSWLKNKKEEFDRQEAEKLAKEKSEQARMVVWKQKASSELKQFVASHLQDLVCTFTIEGEEISIKWADEGTNAILMAGEQPLVELYFTVGVVVIDNRDLFIRKQVKYSREYVCEGWVSHLGGKDSHFCMLEEKELAKYLLNFIIV